MRLDLAVAAIIKEEKLEASDEEVEAEYKKLAEQYGMDVETVKKYLRREPIKAQILNAEGHCRGRATALQAAEGCRRGEEAEEDGQEDGRRSLPRRRRKKTAD